MAAIFEKFSHTLVFNASAEGVSPWNFITAVELIKKNYAAARMSKTFDDASIRFDTVPALVRQRNLQTDRQTELVKQYRDLRALHRHPEAR